MHTFPESLSIDNLFVFLIIFRGLSVPEDEQRRVLFWGIFGALLFRALCPAAPPGAGTKGAGSLGPGGSRVTLQAPAASTALGGAL